MNNECTMNESGFFMVMGMRMRMEMEMWSRFIVLGGLIAHWVRDYGYWYWLHWIDMVRLDLSWLLNACMALVLVEFASSSPSSSSSSSSSSILQLFFSSSYSFVPCDKGINVSFLLYIGGFAGLSIWIYIYWYPRLGLYIICYWYAKFNLKRISLNFCELSFLFKIRV